MKFLVIARLRPAATLPENTLGLFQSTAGWINEHISDGILDCAYNLPAGGGVAIVNALSHEGLAEILGSYPLNPWVDYELHPLSDVRHYFETSIRAMGG